MTSPFKGGLERIGDNAIQSRSPMIDLVPADPPGPALRAMLGDGVPQLVRSGGYGWSWVSRPRQRAGTEWQGVEGWTLKVPVAFDKFKADGSVEGEVRRLLEMASNRVGPRREPPVLRLVYPGMPFPEFRYVLNDIAPTNTLLRVDGIPSYAAFDLTFMQYTALDVMVKKATPAAKAKAASPTAQVAKTRTYTVKKGDTLARIAAANKIPKWQDIANLNGIRDPRALRVGQVLRLP
jgi:LysM repeat protein